MHSMSLLLLFWCALSVCGECDAGEDETCEQQLDSATLLQLRVQDVSGDNLDTSVISEARKPTHEEKKAAKKEKKQEKKDAKKEKKQEKKDAKKKRKEDKEAAELAKAKATYWPTPIPINKSQFCSMGSDNDLMAGVQMNGSFNLEVMMKQIISNANEALSCLKQDKSLQKQYRHQSRQNFVASRKYIRHHGGAKPERRLEEKQAKDVWKQAKQMRKKYRHEVMQAKFKAKILPKVVKLLAPIIHKELGEADLGLVSLVQKGSESVCNLTATGIEKIEWLEYIIRSKVYGAITNETRKIMVPLMKKVWSVAGGVEQSISGALVASLGEIPFVGGILAEAANLAVSTAYNRAKEGVNTALTNLFEHIANETTNAIVNEASKPLDKVKAGLEKIQDVVIAGADKLESAGAAVANAIGKATQTEYKSQADVAEKASVGVHDSILSDGQDSADEDEDTKTQWENSDGEVIGTPPPTPTTTGW